MNRALFRTDRLSRSRGRKGSRTASWSSIPRRRRTKTISLASRGGFGAGSPGRSKCADSRWRALARKRATRMTRFSCFLATPPPPAPSRKVRAPGCAFPRRLSWGGELAGRQRSGATPVPAGSTSTPASPWRPTTAPPWNVCAATLPARRSRPSGSSSPLELIERLAVLVPAPRGHLLVYRGVLAPNAARIARQLSFSETRMAWRPSGASGGACPAPAALGREGARQGPIRAQSIR